MAGEAQVRRWTRYGKDRLYVVADNGDELGWHCLQTGHAHGPADPDVSAVFHALVSTWLAENAHLIPSPRTPTDPPLDRPTVPRVASEARYDLAQNLPGAAAFAAADRVGAARLAAATALQQEAAATAAHLRTTAAVLQAEYRRARPVRAFLRRLFGRDDTEQQITAQVCRILARTPPMSIEEHRFRMGGEGERITGAALARLPRGWYTLHAVPVGRHGADIDHVVLGPAGIFTLNTKHHPGRTIRVWGDGFRVGDRWTRYIEKSRYEAERATRLLAAATGVQMPVTAVIVVVGARRVTLMNAPDDVHVLQVQDLPQWFLTYPTMLPPAQVDRFFQMARDSTVWRT